MNISSDSELDENARQWSALAESIIDQPMSAEGSVPPTRKVLGLTIISITVLLIVSVVGFHAATSQHQQNMESISAVPENRSDTSIRACCKLPSEPSEDCCGE